MAAGLGLEMLLETVVDQRVQPVNGFHPDIAAAAAIVYLIRYKEQYNATYLAETVKYDTFKHWKFIVAPCAVLALLICENRWDPMEVREARSSGAGDRRGPTSTLSAAGGEECERVTSVLRAQTPRQRAAATARTETQAKPRSRHGGGTAAV